MATLTVGKVQALLAPLRPEQEIYLASDEEGNAFHNLALADETLLLVGGLARRVLVLWPGGLYAEPGDDEPLEDQPSSEELKAAAHILDRLRRTVGQ